MKRKKKTREEGKYDERFTENGNTTKGEEVTKEDRE